MSTISGTTPGAATPSAQPTQATGKQAESLGRLNQTYDDFLRLLTTQLQYQDPLNPLDSKEFTNQLVQFSAVEQQISTNQQLTNLSRLISGQTVSAALGFIGLDVSWQGAEFSFAEGGQAIDYRIPASTKAAQIQIYDGDRLVYSGEASRAAGTHRFTWDGALTGGATAETGRTYRVRVAGTDEAGRGFTAETTLTGRATGVESGGEQGTSVRIGSILIGSQDILSARQPAAA